MLILVDLSWIYSLLKAKKQKKTEQKKNKIDLKVLIKVYLIFRFKSNFYVCLFFI